MSTKYTTGEIARLCGVSVRTVQYYDGRGLLVPSELSEGGRRLYTQEDLRRLRIICFLREAGLSLHSIGELLAQPEPAGVIGLLLRQQEEVLEKELSQTQEKLLLLREIRRSMKIIPEFSVDSLGDIACIVKNKKRLRHLRQVILAVGIPAQLLEVGAAVLWALTGIWWPFVLGLLLGAAAGLWISLYYNKNIDYICPQCHRIFHPRFGEILLAGHTTTARKLTCTACGYRGLCVETCHEEPRAEGTALDRPGKG